MHPKEPSVHPGPSSPEPIILDHRPSGRKDAARPEGKKTPSETPSAPPAPLDAETVDTVYKIVYSSDPPNHPASGHVYIRYNVPPERDSTRWFCIVAFYWEDVRAEFECVYHPSIRLFDEFKLVRGSLKGGRRGVRTVQVAMWNFADRGPELNVKHTVRDDRGDRILLAVMMLRDRSAVRLHGKMVRDGEDEGEVWLSGDECARLGLRV